MTSSEGVVWPGKPERPRIKYLWSLHDVGAPEAEEKNYADILTGKTPGDEGEDVLTVGRLVKPQAIYVDDNRLYIADPGAGRVTVVDKKTMDVIHISETKDEALEYPLSVVVDGQGKIYVSDPDLNMVIAYSAEGRSLYNFEGGMQRPTGLAIDKQRGVLYIVDSLAHCVYIYGLDGKRKGLIGKRGSSDGEFNFPSHAFVDNKGRLYVTDFLNFRIQIFSPEGEFLKKFGEPGDGFGAFDKPKGVAVDTEGNIYIADAGKDMVKIFNQEGKLLLFFGEKGRRYGDFYMPTGIFIDNGNIIYIADTVNKRIQAFQFLGGD